MLHIQLHGRRESTPTKYCKESPGLNITWAFLIKLQRNQVTLSACSDPYQNI